MWASSEHRKGIEEGGEGVNHKCYINSWFWIGLLRLSTCLWALESCDFPSGSLTTGEWLVLDSRISQAALHSPRGAQHLCWSQLSGHIRVAIAEKKQHDESSLRRKRFIWLTLLHHRLLVKEVMVGTQTGQEPGCRS